VTLTVDNPGSGNQFLATIHLDSIAACSVAWTYPAGTCSGTTIAGCGSINNGSVANAGTADFYMADVAVNTDYAPGAGQPAPNGSLVMNNLASSQDACKNAFLKLNLSST
jgi:hypothetical protein